MEPVSTIVEEMASFDSLWTAPTAENLRVLLRGAILGTGPHTVTQCIWSAWPWVTKHWSVYENVPRRARMNMLEQARILFGLTLELLPPESVIELLVDESLVRRYGPHVAGTGMHRDAVRSSHGYHAVTPGHKWVVLSVVVRLPSMRRAIALPILSVLYTSARPARRNRERPLYRQHRTPVELAKLLVQIVVRWAPNRRFHLIGDGSYGTHELADELNPASEHSKLKRVSLVSRLHMEAAIYERPVPYGGKGRPPEKGAKLPSPREVASNPRTRWIRKRVAWYGGTSRTVLLCSHTGLWYRRGTRPTLVRWVVVRVPHSGRPDEAFFTTDLSLTPQQIIETFVLRWGEETTFQEARSLLGLETLRNRSPNAVRRSVPLLMSVYSLVVLWFARHVSDPNAYRQSKPWYIKAYVTFSDMLAAARQDILNELVLSRAHSQSDEPKLAGSSKPSQNTLDKHFRISA